MNVLFRGVTGEVSGVRTILGGGTNATTPGAALNNLFGVSFTGNQIISGNKIFTSGIIAPNLIYNTGDQTISGIKTFSNTGVFTSGIDLRNSRLINHVPEIVTINSNFIISGNLNSDVVLANSPTQITGTLISGNPLGFHVSIIQIGVGGYIRITGSGSNVIVNSANNRFRTSAQFAQINILHTGNNGYIMYGDTQS